MSTPPSAKRPASPDSPEAGNAHKRAREDTSTDAASSPATKTEAAPATTASNGAPSSTDKVKVEGESNGEKAKDAASAEKNKGGDSKKMMEDSNMDGWVIAVLIGDPAWKLTSAAMPDPRSHLPL